MNPHLVSLKSIQQRDAHHSRLDTRVVGQRREGQRLHLDVDHPCLVDALQVLHLVRLVELAECAVETTLPWGV